MPLLRDAVVPSPAAIDFFDIIMYLYSPHCITFAIGMTGTNILQGKKAAYFTLGCKLNFSETSTFARMLHGLGVETAGEGEPADICVINTCSVTDVAEHKCRQAINRATRENPRAFIVVTGCYAQLRPEAIRRLPGVDLVLGTDEKASLLRHVTEAMALKEVQNRVGERAEALHEMRTSPVKDIRTFVPSCSRGNRTRFFLKVQDGCDYFCSYCTIPFARGRSRNATIASIVSQAEQAAGEGGKEIVITGVNIGDFGKSTGERFIDLVRALDKVEGISRYRISSIEPDLLDDELIAFCAGSRAFMPHFHIPLQSGSDTVLRLMRRRYDTGLFAHKIQKIRDLMPDAFIGVDVMVGFRGESQECFEECLAFLKDMDVTQLHVFPYSERPGTAALRMPLKVPAADKKLRSKCLLELSTEKRLSFYARHTGTEADVLFEKPTRGRAMHGFTPNYIRAELPRELPSKALDNRVARVRLGGFNNDKSALTAELLHVYPE